MAENLLKKYMQEGGMMPREEGPPREEAPAEAPAQEEAPEKEVSVVGILKELAKTLMKWEKKEYESDKDRWQEYYDDIANLISSYIESVKGSDDKEKYFLGGLLGMGRRRRKKRGHKRFMGR